jgi:hypothetical protein
MSRLSKAEAKIVREGLTGAATDQFRHPDRFPRKFGDIWISTRQCQEYLRRLANDGLIRVAHHSRGWYAWNTYAKRIDPISVKKVYDAYYKQFRREGYGYASRNLSGVPLKAANSYIMSRWAKDYQWVSSERAMKFYMRFYEVTGTWHPNDPIPF